MQKIESELPLLESPAALARLLMTWRGTVRPKVAPQSTRPIRTQRVCSCGACARCRDNARWERIFNEKFADPSYYGGIKMRQNSSLAR